MTALCLGLLIAFASPQPGAQVFGAILAIGGGMFMWLARYEEQA